MWWVTGVPGVPADKHGPAGCCGPYPNRALAVDDLEGLLRWYRQMWEDDDGDED